MGLMQEPRPIREPYSDEIRAELQTAWEMEKERLIEADVTIPRNVEALARRVFYAGFIAALNTPPF